MCENWKVFVEIMAFYGYHIVMSDHMGVFMKSVNIAKFKAELGKYLGYIRKGEEIIVLDRSHPLARLIPIKETVSVLVSEDPSESSSKLINLHFPPIKNKKVDSLKFLNEERGDR